MLPIIGIALVIFAIAIVVNLILHPIQTLRKFARFICALLAVTLPLGSIVVFLQPKSSFGDWIGPAVMVIAGITFSILYNLLAPSRAA